MDITVTGPDPLPQRPADEKAAKRRELVQSCFKELDPKTTARLMLVHDISAQELQQAMDYKMDAIGWMRESGFPDGFQGLKVWPEEEVDLYYRWQATAPNPLNLAITRPSWVSVQAIMDREFGAAAINPAHKIPWRRYDSQ